MVALSDGETLDLRLIDGGAAPLAAPAAGVVAGDAARSAAPEPGLRAQVEAFERRLLVEAMAETHGNQAEAARLLRIGRATMHDKLRKHGIND
jgi:DNA-binding NtrC family response regulator